MGCFYFLTIENNAGMYMGALTFQSLLSGFFLGGEEIFTQEQNYWTKWKSDV